jgi:hypothetical protein
MSYICLYGAVTAVSSGSIIPAFRNWGGGTCGHTNNNPICKHPVALLYLKLLMYYTVRQQCNKLLLLKFSLSTQHVSALNGHLQVSY